MRCSACGLLCSTFLCGILFRASGGELFGGIRAFLESTGLIFPVRTMETTGSAFWRDAFGAAVEMGIRRFLHQGTKYLCRIFYVHCFDLRFCKKNKPCHCSAVRSAIAGLCCMKFLSYFFRIRFVFRIYRFFLKAEP